MAKKKKASKKNEPRRGRPRDERSTEELLKALEKTSDAGEKRRLRAKLRSRGHTGGLRESE